MFIVGLTGGISTGKSTVSSFFKEYAIPVIDSDIIARKVVEPGTKASKALRKAFGDNIFHKDGTLNRDALGDAIFSDDSKRRIVNEITHPEIYKEMLWQTVGYFLQGHQFIVMDLPLLYETGYMLDYIHKVIVVFCEEDLQLQRLMERNGFSEAKAKARISAQMRLEEKCEKADFVVDNSNSVADTREQMVAIIHLLRSSKHHWKNRALIVLFSIGLISLITLVGYLFFK